MRSAILVAAATAVGVGVVSGCGDTNVDQGASVVVQEIRNGDSPAPSGVVVVELHGSCSGFFVSRDVIATAAHCVLPVGASAPSSGQFQERVCTRLSHSDPREFEEVTVHLSPAYVNETGPPNRSIDIAFLKRSDGEAFTLYEPAGGRLYVNMGSLSAYDAFHVFGFGKVEENTPGDELRHWTFAKERVSGSLLVTNALEWGGHWRGVCKGDSGGLAAYSPMYHPEVFVAAAVNASFTTGDPNNTCSEPGDEQFHVRLASNPQLLTRALGHGCARALPNAPYADNIRDCNWTCQDALYGDGVCDCGCGIVDSDCDDGRPWTEDGCAPEGCWHSRCERCVSQNGEHQFDCGAWTCDFAAYGDGVCDCGCGVEDVDCNLRGCATPGCRTLACEMCDGRPCEPRGYYCGQDAYNDELCDCGCGGHDAACGTEGCTGPNCYREKCDVCHDPSGSDICNVICRAGVGCAAKPAACSAADCFDDLVLYASDYLKLNDGVQVVGAQGWGAVGCQSQIRFETRVETGNVYGTGIELQPFAQVHGDVATLTQPWLADPHNTTVNWVGLIGQQFPSDIYVETVRAPSAGSTPYVYAERGQTKILSADEVYLYVGVRDGGTAKLSCTTSSSHISSLRVERGGSLFVPNCNAGQILDVYGDLNVDGDIYTEGNYPLMIRFHGNHEIFTTGTLDDVTIFAPEASLKIQSHDLPQFGAFYAKRIEVAQRSTIVHAPWYR